MKKPQFLKSAKLAVASILLVCSLSSCKMMGMKHQCMHKHDEMKSEKVDATQKPSDSTKEEKMNCSSSTKKCKSCCKKNK